MKYTHATLLLDQTGAEINEQNLTAVLEAADAEFTVSRVKAVVAALEGVDLSEYAAAPPESDAAGAGDPESATETATKGTTAPDADLPVTDGEAPPGTDSEASVDGSAEGT